MSNFQEEPRWIRLTQYNDPDKPIINDDFDEHSFGVFNDMAAIMPFVNGNSTECIKVPKGECAAFFDNDDDDDPTHFVTRLPDQDDGRLVRKPVSSPDIKNQVVSWLELIQNMDGYEDIVTIIRMPVKDECLKNPYKQTYIVIALEYWSDDDEDGDVDDDDDGQDDGDAEDADQGFEIVLHNGDYIEDLNEDFNNNLNLNLQDNIDYIEGLNKDFNNNLNLDLQDNQDNLYQIPEWFG